MHCIVGDDHVAWEDKFSDKLRNLLSAYKTKQSLFDVAMVEEALGVSPAPILIYGELTGFDIYYSARFLFYETLVGYLGGSYDLQELYGKMAYCLYHCQYYMKKYSEQDEVPCREVRIANRIYKNESEIKSEHFTVVQGSLLEYCCYL